MRHVEESRTTCRSVLPWLAIDSNAVIAHQAKAHRGAVSGNSPITSPVHRRPFTTALAGFLTYYRGPRLMPHGSSSCARASRRRRCSRNRSLRRYEEALKARWPVHCRCSAADFLHASGFETAWWGGSQRPGALGARSKEATALDVAWLGTLAAAAFSGELRPAKTAGIRAADHACHGVAFSAGVTRSPEGSAMARHGCRAPALRRPIAAPQSWSGVRRRPAVHFGAGSRTSPAGTAPGFRAGRCGRPPRCCCPSARRMIRWARSASMKVELRGALGGRAGRGAGAIIRIDPGRHDWSGRA